MRTDDRAESTPMADQGAARPLRRDSLTGVETGDGGVLPGPLHALGVGGDGAPLASGPPAGAGVAVPGDRGADGSVDDDRDARGALAAPRRGRLSHSARPLGLLRVAVPAKGRLRDPSFHLLEDA